jgi:hypothetical protein
VTEVALKEIKENNVEEFKHEASVLQYGKFWNILIK